MKANMNRTATASFFRFARYKGAEKNYKGVCKYMPVFIELGLVSTTWETALTHQDRLTDKGREFYKALCSVAMEDVEAAYRVIEERR
jgi:hypothetical protein